MKTLPLLLSLLVLAPFAGLSAPHFTDEGLEFDAGSLGKFTLEYPQLLGADQQPAHKLREKIRTVQRRA